MARMTRGDRPAEAPAKHGEQEPAPEAADGGDELRKKLLTRAAVAAVLVAALLAVLAVFDALNAPPPKQPPVAAVAQPEEAKPEAAKPEEAKPTETPPAEKTADKEAEKAAGADKLAAAGEPRKGEEKKAGESEKKAAETEKSAPPTTAGAKPERPLTKPAQARQAIMKPSEPAFAAKRVEPGAAVTQPLAQRQPHVGAPASRPLTQALEAARGFLLQLGVFNNTANAEELRAKLELNGIPSQIEARVQVGPFKSREEAEAARTKLRALGMEPGVLVAIKK